MFAIHNTFSREMAVIGRLLVDYGELEVDLMNCVRDRQILRSQRYPQGHVSRTRRN